MRNIFSIIFTTIMLLLSACGQGQLRTPKDAMTKFEQFKRKEKFGIDEKLFYNGLGNPELKPTATEKINLSADDFKRLAEKGTVTDKEYQDAIKIGLDRFADVYLDLDTEDRERVCNYYEELMDIVGLESSGGHLNRFMYGFDPTEVKKI